jgi:transcription antitermination factor NusG
MTVETAVEMNPINQTDQADQSACWYALRTKSRHEKVVRDQLKKQGIEPLLLTIRRLSQWKDRKKEIEVPLFSGYCFVRFGQVAKSVIHRVAGVVEIVGSGGRPEPIPDSEIENLKKFVTAVLSYDPHPYLHEGMLVEVVRGPLQGVRGILLRKENRHRLVVGVRLIRQAAAVEIDVRDVELVHNSFIARREHGSSLT